MLRSSTRLMNFAKALRAMADRVFRAGSISPKVASCPRRRRSDRSRSRVCRAAERSACRALRLRRFRHRRRGVASAKRADEIGARSPACRSVQFALDARHRDREILVRPGPARGIDARRAVQRVDRQTGIVGERGRSAGLCRGARLQRGIPAKVVSVSSGSASPSAAAPMVSMPKGASRASISRTLPGLWLATTSAAAAAQAVHAERLLLQRDQFADAFARQLQQLRRIRSSLKGAPSAVP